MYIDPFILLFQEYIVIQFICVLLSVLLNPICTNTNS